VNQPQGLRAVSGIALLALAGFIVAALSTQFLRDDLDWMQATLSLYLHGPGGLLLRLAYALLALALVLLGTGLFRHSRGARRSGAAPLLFAMAALGLLGVAVGDSWLPTHAPLLWPLVHGVAANAAFLCASVAMLLQAWYLRCEPGWERTAVGLWWWAWLAFGLLWMHVLWRTPARGAGQKLVIAVIVAWLVAVAWAGWRRRGLPVDHHDRIGMA